MNPKTAEDATFKSFPMIPLAVVLLASVLEEDGHEVMVVDRNLQPQGMEGILETFKPQLVGISVLTGPCILDALFISRLCKQLLPLSPVVWGGVHPTLDTGVTLAEPSIDIVVRREGEDTLRDLVRALSWGTDLKQVQGISFRKDGHFHHNPLRPFIKNLDLLPLPAWHLVDMKTYIWQRSGRKYLGMNTSRGCSFNCAFCYNLPFNERRWRGLSAERAMEHIRHLTTHYGVGYIEFLEDNFTLNKKRLEGICDRLIKEDWGLRWYCEGRIGSMSRELLAKMKRAGCAGLAFGVESGSPRILEMLCKGITVEQTMKTFQLCWDVGIRPDAYVIAGLPTETPADWEMTLKLLETIRPGLVEVMVYRPYPGTELYEYCVAQGLFTPPQDLETWGRIADQHSPTFSVGALPEPVLLEAINKTTVFKKKDRVLS